MRHFQVKLLLLLIQVWRNSEKPSAFPYMFESEWKVWAASVSVSVPLNPTAIEKETISEKPRRLRDKRKDMKVKEARQWQQRKEEVESCNRREEKFIPSLKAGSSTIAWSSGVGFPRTSAPHRSPISCFLIDIFERSLSFIDSLTCTLPVSGARFPTHAHRFLHSGLHFVLVPKDLGIRGKRGEHLKCTVFFCVGLDFCFRDNLWSPIKVK